MLFRRTCLLVDYEDANRALDKAKPAKRQAVSMKLSKQTGAYCAFDVFQKVVFSLTLYT